MLNFNRSSLLLGFGMLLVLGCYSGGEQSIGSKPSGRQAILDFQEIQGEWISSPQNRSEYLGFAFDAAGGVKYWRKGLTCSPGFEVMKFLENRMADSRYRVDTSECQERVGLYLGKLAVMDGGVGFADSIRNIYSRPISKHGDSLFVVYDRHNKGGLSGLDTIYLMKKPTL